MVAAFFDLGDTIANVAVSDTNDLSLTVLPGARESLQALARAHHRVGLISNRGHIPEQAVRDALRAVNLYELFSEELIVFGAKDHPDIFRRATEIAQVPSVQCFFTGESPRERFFAIQAGYGGVSPHPVLTGAVIAGQALVYVVVTVTDDSRFGTWLASSRSFVPIRVAGTTPRLVYAIASVAELGTLREAGFGVDTLGEPGAPLTTDLYLVRDDRPTPAGFSPENHSLSFLQETGKDHLLVHSAAEGSYLAIPWDRSIEEIHFPDASHGHNDKLIPDPLLLEPFRGNKRPTFAPGFGEVDELSPAVVEALKIITPDLIKRLHEPYAGFARLDGLQVQSRHIRHQHNRHVVSALQKDIREGTSQLARVSLHRFRHEDLELFNVVGELPGESEALVLITAHLDSTAAFDETPYDPSTDPAPGADDDASGMAAVLAAGMALKSIYGSTRPAKSIQLVLFNAEEHGLIGSKAYARTIAATRREVAGVFQMDMIGYRKRQENGASAPGNFEVHAGCASFPAVEKQSLLLAGLLTKMQSAVSPDLAPPLVYPQVSPGGRDPAAGRSDHSPFQERGYPACVVSEHFFTGPKPTSPAADPNPNYHKAADRYVDYAYASAIARLVAAAAVTLAGSAST
jgi:bacterial leucyl aminopeptidase